MSHTTRHVRKYLCDLAELRNGMEAVAVEGGNPPDWTTWRGLRPDTAENNGSMESLLNLLTRTSLAI
jgi:hypothetical protein